ncbi:hypothetical protein [uncultured Erythrobacter sp.]|uniref:hypothetical protein n=1 Tax=uncultured Erythrobacter sp. TaxID=263913 RepID=UPI00260D072E|nr:hypothetical protein [uncultured Erythrobacter sp.]
MKCALTIGLVSTLTLSLAACASGAPRGPSNKVIERVLAKAPGKAQPSAIVSTEIAYARAAQEQSFAEAALAFAAPGAQMHLRDGVVPIEAIAQGLAEAGIETQWGPRVVVKSCDGSLALSQGRFVDGEGKVGNYVTTWVRQADGTYKWTYDAAGLDDPQPPPRPDFEDGDIVVTAFDLVEGLIATCPRAGENVPAAPAIPAGGGGASAIQVSRDGTLRWRWEHLEGNLKYVKADYYFEGQWVTAIEQTLASAPEE